MRRLALAAVGLLVAPVDAARAAADELVSWGPVSLGIAEGDFEGTVYTFVTARRAFQFAVTSRRSW